MQPSSRVFPTGRKGKVPPPAKNLLIPPTKFLSPLPLKVNSLHKAAENVYYWHCSCTILINFILFWHSRGHANFDFNWCSLFTRSCFLLWKSWNGQNHSSSDSEWTLSKKIPAANFLIPKWGRTPPHTLLLFGKSCLLK